MAAKIFITGFQRGGTTLLRRLLHAHPEVNCILHESRVLNKTTNKKKLDKIVRNCKLWQGNFEEVWGEKIPWNSADGQEAIDYINKWIQVFNEEARIINIIRNPYDTGLSNQKLGWLSQEIVKDNWNKSMPKVISYVNKVNGLNIVYENLLLTPEKVLERVFEYCSLDSSKELISLVSNLDRKSLRYFDKIDPSRAFVVTTLQEMEDYKRFIKGYWLL